MKARKHIREELNKAIEEIRVKLEKEAIAGRQEIEKLIAEDEKVKFWIMAWENIEGYTDDGIQNWQYVLIQSEIVRLFCFHCCSFIFYSHDSIPYSINAAQRIRYRVITPTSFCNNGTS